MEVADVERAVIERLGAEVVAGGRLLQAIRGGRDSHIALLDIRPGFVIDPIRDRPLALAEDQTLRPPADEFVAAIAETTGCPKLTAAQHRSLFSVLAEELARTSYDTSSGWAFETLVTAVEETCERHGVAVPREAIAFVLVGIEELDKTEKDGSSAEAFDLAHSYARRVAAICAEKEIVLSADERTVLALWLGAAPEPEASIEAQAGEDTLAVSAPPPTDWNVGSARIPETLAEAARIAGSYVAAHGPTPVIQLASVFRREIPVFRDNYDWMGFGRITTFFDYLASLDPTLQLDRSQPRNWILWRTIPAPDQFLEVVCGQLDGADGLISAEGPSGQN